MKVHSSAFTALLFLALPLRRHSVSADVVLSEKIMSLSLESAILSNLAYEANPNSTAYDELTNFIDEPDQALFVKKDGYCIGSFRGTTLTADDWSQNFDPRSEPICMELDPDSCCKTRQGFYDAYNTVYVDAFEKAIRECAEGCENKDECVVLTGHSQGGAVATVAAIRFANLNPYIITFGQPPTIDAPCTLINSERYYRFVNTRTLEMGNLGMTYDPIPFAPGMGTDSFGHMIMLGNDVADVAYIGLDSQEHFDPLDVTAGAHSMVGDGEGYIDRLVALTTNASYPIKSSGFSNPSYCTEDIECESEKCERETTFAYKRCVSDECEEDIDCINTTNRCDAGACLPKLGSCMTCDEDSDCKSGVCYLFRCANEAGLMDNECNCVFNKDCDSGRCEGYLSTHVCEAKLANGAGCNENSDCMSGYCSWSLKGLKCADRSVVNATADDSTGSDTSTNKGSTMTTAIIILAIVAVIGIAWAVYVAWRKKAQYTEVPTDVV